MMRGLQIDFETADRIAVCTMKDQLKYLRREQEWFEADAEKRRLLIVGWGHPMYVHEEDYANNRDKYIPALETLIEYFGGSV